MLLLHISSERVAAFKEFALLFVQAVTAAGPIRDIRSFVLVSDDGIELRLDRDTPDGGYDYVEDFYSFRERDWIDPAKREEFAKLVACNLLETLETLEPSEECCHDPGLTHGHDGYGPDDDPDDGPDERPEECCHKHVEGFEGAIRGGLA